MSDENIAMSVLVLFIVVIFGFVLWLFRGERDDDNGRSWSMAIALAVPTTCAVVFAILAMLFVQQHLERQFPPGTGWRTIASTYTTWISPPVNREYCQEIESKLAELVREESPPGNAFVYPEKWDALWADGREDYANAISHCDFEWEPVTILDAKTARVLAHYSFSDGYEPATE